MKQDHTMILYLHLKNPPITNVVKIDFKTKEGDTISRSDVRTMFGDRYVHWIPHDNLAEIKEQIRPFAESPYVRIEFTKSDVSLTLNRPPYSV